MSATKFIHHDPKTMDILDNFMYTDFYVFRSAVAGVNISTFGFVALLFTIWFFVSSSFSIRIQTKGNNGGPTMLKKYKYQGNVGLLKKVSATTALYALLT
jgi:hypothetical protein